MLKRLSAVRGRPPSLQSALWPSAEPVGVRGDEHTDSAVGAAAAGLAGPALRSRPLLIGTERHPAET